MKTDYHMHFEKGSYDTKWAEGFFVSAMKRGIGEIGFTDHSHTFPEFKDLYYEDLILDDSFVGSFQKEWLKKNKFKYTIPQYIAFVESLRREHSQTYGIPVKTGIEVCNFRNQEKVRDILKEHDFDYVIGSVHFLKGWAYDYGEIKSEWDRHSLEEVYEWYTEEIEHLAASGLYDVLGHPFNLRVYLHIPEFDVSPFIERAVKALKDADMAIDVNTGTCYRYPIHEISPYPEFMKVAAKYELPIMISSDAHQPEDCGSCCNEAIAYVRRFGYTKSLRFSHRERTFVDID